MTEAREAYKTHSQACEQCAKADKNPVDKIEQKKPGAITRRCPEGGKLMLAAMYEKRAAGEYEAAK